jgi:hypothetical protein
VYGLAGRLDVAGGVIGASSRTSRAGWLSRPPSPSSSDVSFLRLSDGPSFAFSGLAATRLP